MSGQYFPPYGSSSNIKVQLDLTNYATKDDVKNTTHVDVSGYATKTYLAALKTEVGKIDTDKLKTVPADLAKLTNVVKYEVVKKTDFNADDFGKKTKCSADTNSLDDKIDKAAKKIPDVSNLATKSSVTTSIKNVDDKIDKVDEIIPDVSNLAIESSVTTSVKNLDNKIDKIDLITLAKKKQVYLIIC